MVLLISLWALIPLVTCLSLHTQLNHGYNYGFLRKKVKNPHLLAFHDDSEFSKAMEPLVKRVSDETGLHIELIKVDNKKGFIMYYKAAGLCDTKSVPLYYNLKSGHSIVGVTSFENLRAWALGLKPSDVANVSLQALEDASYRVTGYWGRIQRIMRQIRLKGEERMIKRG